MMGAKATTDRQKGIADGESSSGDSSASGNEVNRLMKEAIVQVTESSSTSSPLSIHLNGKQCIQSVDVIALCKALREHSTHNLTDLNLLNNKITDGGVIALSEILTPDSPLQRLHLGYNQVTDAGLKPLAEALRGGEGCCNLTDLHLPNNLFTDLGIIALADALRSNSRLTELDISSNRTSDKSAAALADALHPKGSLMLQRLDFGCAGITAKGIEALAETLKDNTSLQLLSLFDNQIHSEGAAALAEALRHNKALTYLALSSCGVGDDGAIALAEALVQNNALQSIALVRNGITSKGAQVFAETLRRLKVAFLSLNDLGDVGVRAIAEALHENTVTEVLDIFNVDCGDSGAEALAEALCNNTTLQRLSFHNNPRVTERGLRALREAHQSRHNPNLLTLLLPEPSRDNTPYTPLRLPMRNRNMDCESPPPDREN